MEAFRPRLVELDDMLDQVLLSLRSDRVRSDLVGETRPAEFVGLER